MEGTEFEHIAAGLRQKVIGTSINLGLKINEAEDIAQDVMLKLWSMHGELERFRSVEALAVVMAKRLVLNEQRKTRASSLSDSEHLIADKGNTPSEILEKDETEKWLNRKIDALPTTQHTILYMRQVERRSNEEIAQLLGIEKDSVCALLSKARTSLLNEIKQRMATEEKRISKIRRYENNG